MDINKIWRPSTKLITARQCRNKIEHRHEQYEKIIEELFQMANSPDNEILVKNAIRRIHKMAADAYLLKWHHDITERPRLIHADDLAEYDPEVQQ